jgi:hypothetical protein
MEPNYNPQTMGEEFMSKLEFQWLEVGKEIPAGTLFGPIKIPTTEQTTEISALYSAKEDLTFALFCFKEAIKHDIPKVSNPISKALINAGTLSYARVFSRGVHKFKITEEYFSNLWDIEDSDLHKYLSSLRDKHIAHSVNDFKRAEAVGVVTISNDLRLLSTNPFGVGVGVVLTVSIGLPFVWLKQCPMLMEKMITFIDGKINALRIEIYKQFHPTLKVGDKVEIHPFIQIANRDKIEKRRND